MSLSPVNTRALPQAGVLASERRRTAPSTPLLNPMTRPVLHHYLRLTRRSTKGREDL